MLGLDQTLLQQGLLKVNRALKPLDMLCEGDTSETNQRPPLFILGVPRSGTTLAYQVITQQLEVGYMTAPVNYIHGLSNLMTHVLRPCLGRPRPDFKSKYGHIRGICSPGEYTHYWYQWFPVYGEQGHHVDPDFVDLDAYATLRNSLYSMSSILKRPMVFKNLYLTMAAGALAKIFPSARFLVIQRDPLLVCQSLLRGRMQQKNSQQWWSVKPPHYREWLALPLWQQVARQVFFTEYYLQRDLSYYAADRVYTIQYTDLCREPAACVERIHDWLRTVGYQSYSDTKIPSSFRVSSELTLDPNIEELIRKELESLGQMYNAPDL